MMKTAFIQTPIGVLEIIGNSLGLSFVIFKDNEVVIETEEIPEDLKDAVIQLREYFEGSRMEFTLKLAPKGTDFQKRVWEELQKIPYGKTVNYLQIAKRLGDPKVIRAAASAN